MNRVNQGEFVIDVYSCNGRVSQTGYNFPQDAMNVPEALDGFFGRPLVYVSAIFLKPLSERRRVAFVREINKISKIQDRWEREIKLIA